MRLAFSLGSLLTVNEIIRFSKTLEKYNLDTIFIPETWGMESFAMLSMVSTSNQKAKIGSSIINIYSRSPALVAMGAATVDTISNKRLVLGLGTSSQPIVEDFHGNSFERPLSRMREYIEIIRLVLSKRKIDYSGKFFTLKNFTLLIDPPRKEIPIYLAAINENMVNLAWETGEGVIFYLRPLNEMKKTITKMQSKRNIDVSCQIITCVSNDSELAIKKAKKTISFYIAVGKIYREFLAKNGFHNETRDIFEEFKRSGLERIHEIVSDRMLNELSIVGTPEECIKKFSRFIDTGMTLPIIQFNPVGNVSESFNLMTKTFGEIIE